MSIASSTAAPPSLTGRFSERRQGELEPLSPVIKPRLSTLQQDNESLGGDTTIGKSAQPTEYVIPILPARLRSSTIDLHEDAVVLQIWEGTVLEVDRERQLMRSSLRSKQGNFEDHAGDIHFEWVMDQDRDLMRPGAVFYLTLYKSRRRGGTIVNSQELRFRRMPAWTQRQVAEVGSLAEGFLRKIKTRPVAE